MDSIIISLSSNACIDEVNMQNPPNNLATGQMKIEQFS